MIIHTEIYGFGSEDLDVLTAELTRVLEIIPRLGRSDAYGSDLSIFGDFGKPGGRLELFLYHTVDINYQTYDGFERIVHEDEYPEMGSILSIQ